MDRMSNTVLAQAEGLPREALMIILQLTCRRHADICLGSTPTDPLCIDETVHMWIEDCAARNLLVRWHRVMMRKVIVRVNFLSISAICRMASLSSAWREAADCTFQGEYFLLYRDIPPSPWRYISARWITNCLLYVVAEAKYIDLLLLCRRRR